ncbi:MAG: hypothetical protein HKN37_14350 [Rhodothermales bacterium]|nr:hypothetical protein [Rhodothermales bacterium]
MTRNVDPTEPIRKRAAAFPAIARGTSCNQSSFKTGKRTFLYIGPGPKGIGFKAMFKLEASMPQARKLAAQNPHRFEVGSTGWVTARFTSDEPMPKKLWSEWLEESYALSSGPGPKRK